MTWSIFILMGFAEFSGCCFFTALFAFVGVLALFFYFFFPIEFFGCSCFLSMIVMFLSFSLYFFKDLTWVFVYFVVFHDWH